MLELETLSVNAMEYKEADDNKQRCVNTVMGELDRVRERGGGPLQFMAGLEEEDDFCVYHVNALINEDAPHEPSPN